MFGEICSAQYKVIILGSHGVGKTSLIGRKFGHEFVTSIKSTNSMNSFKIIVETSGQKVELQCWDTASQEIFDSIVKMYYRGCSAAIIVYDITNIESFKKVETYVERVKEYGGKNCLMMLIGNKLDLAKKREVSYSSGVHLAKMHGMMFFETSCKNYVNIDDAFELITQNLLSQPIEVQSSFRGSLFSSSIVLSQGAEKKRKNKCCMKGSKRNKFDD